MMRGNKSFPKVRERSSGRRPSCRRVLPALILLALSAGAAAAAELEVSPTPVVIDAIQGVSPAIATFYITASERIDQIELLSMDVAPAPGSTGRAPRILASQITFQPPKLDKVPANEAQRVIVTVGNLTTAGEWKGQMEFRWKIAGEGDTAERHDARMVGLEIQYRTTPAIELSAPTKLIVQATRGSETIRMATITETRKGSSAEGIAFSYEPLLTADQTRALPADAVYVPDPGNRGAPALATERGANRAVPTSAPTSLAPGSRAEIPLVVDLGKAEAGAYTGNLVLTSNAPDLKIPVEIRVREKPLWPCIVLLLGVVIALGITYYRTNVMPKDQVRVRVGALYEHLGADAEFDRYCGLQKVHPQLVLTQQHLRADKIDAARTAVAVAEDLWDRWVAARTELLANISAVEAILHEIVKVNGFNHVSSILALRQTLQETVRDKIPEYVAQPKALVDLIEDPATGWRPTVEVGLQLFVRLQALEGNLSEADEASRKAIEGEFHKLKTASVETLQPLLDDALKLQPQAGRLARAPVSLAITARQAPLAVAARARLNLRLIRIATGILAVLLLGIVGWNELYLSNPTFGADWLSDYFKLFAWGFGAEAGRAQVATLVKGWGVLTPIS